MVCRYIRLCSCMHTSSIGKWEYRWEIHGAKWEPNNGSEKGPPEVLMLILLLPAAYWLRTIFMFS